jgi:hypothetical protein
MQNGRTVPSRSSTDRWFFEERRGKRSWFSTAAFAALLLSAAWLIAARGVPYGTLAGPLVLSVGVLLLTLRSLARKTVVIDRRTGTIVLSAGGYAPGRKQIRSLQDFEGIAVWERRNPMDAGSYATRYSIVLLGGKGPFELVAMDDEKEAAEVRDGLAAFLGFR